MIPVGDNLSRRHTPILTWTLVALNVILFVWDRQGSIFGPSIAFADLTMRPLEVVNSLRGDGDTFAYTKVFTAMFLHGNLLHLISNIIYLVVFGPPIEEAFGSWRYLFFYIFWGLGASAAHIYVESSSLVPTLGASGAIGGILGAYLLLFPASKIEIVVPYLAFLSFEVSAWILLGLWFLYQILVPQAGVAQWAHVGGFLTGMLTVLMAGGRDMVLAGRDPERDFSS